jgi:hypothetical protein
MPRRAQREQRATEDRSDGARRPFAGPAGRARSNREKAPKSQSTSRFSLRSPRNLSVSAVCCYKQQEFMPGY